jgi:energy-coupling factor transporter ATP-binding protein EcfA2
MIEVERVTKRYGDKLAVEDLTFAVEPGIVTGFLGPNGAGKSTTMRMIVGLDAPTAGRITVNGRAYRSFSAPLHEVGAMLEARAIHTVDATLDALVIRRRRHRYGRSRTAGGRGADEPLDRSRSPRPEGLRFDRHRRRRLSPRAAGHRRPRRLGLSGEYSTGMIRSSLVAVPRRLPVLWAKLGVFGAATFGLMLAASFVSFFTVQAIVRQRHVQHMLGDPHSLRAVVGTALFLTVLGALALGLGALVRSTAAGIALFVFLLFVLPGTTAILPASVANSVNPYLPLNAGFAVTTSTFENSHHMAPRAGFALFCGYAAVALGAAAVALLRRDA